MRLTSALLACLILLNFFNGKGVFANSYRVRKRSLSVIGIEVETGSLMITPFCLSLLSHVACILLPLMGYFKQVNQEIDEFKVEVENKNNQIKNLEENSFKLHKEVESYVSKDIIIRYLEERDKSNAELISFLKQQNQALIKLIETQTSTDFEKENNTIAKLNEKVKSDSEKLMKCETELKEQTEINKLNEQQTLKFEREIEKSTNESKAIIVKNARICFPYENFSGVHKITMRNGNTFEVLCNSDIAGPGWTIIQQRIKGGVDFKRNWIECKEGFGDFWDGDFFLGLEKIHRLTTEEPQELYIHVEQLDGSSVFAKYDEFAISGEDDQYRLIKLVGYSGNSDYDRMSHNKNMKFSTYERDNDNYHENCSTFYHGGAGWWFNQCSLKLVPFFDNLYLMFLLIYTLFIIINSNLNGIYRDSGPFNTTTIYWNERKPLKRVRMMIRPWAA